jgi:hypothetical protein
MLGNVLTRRGALLSFGAFVGAGLSGCNTTPSAVQPGAASGGGAITVDTPSLMNPTAGWVQQSLPGELAQVLGSGGANGSRALRGRSVLEAWRDFQLNRAHLLA